MFVKPTEMPGQPGVLRIIRKPHVMTPLANDGEEVPDHDFYWLTLLRDGDIAITDKPDEGHKN